MKIYLLLYLFLALISMPVGAQNMTVVDKIKRGGMAFELTREKNNAKTTLAVEINQMQPPVWSTFVIDGSGGGTTLDSWHLLDAYAKGNDVALLLSTESDYRLLWVKATKANGVWTTDFEQKLYGATLPQRHPGKMALNGTDSVVVADDKGQAMFTRNGVGDVLKDGVFFHKSRPGQTLDKP
jgi:hypothetical protein